ncbi:MAG: hypothetical protein ACOYM3_25250 [Terrimicrobiaceae bacterium]
MRKSGFQALISIRFTDTLFKSSKQTMPTTFAAVKKPSKREVPSQPMTIGMTDEQFELWMRSQGGFPIDQGEKEDLQLRGLYMALPPKKSRRAA